MDQNLLKTSIKQRIIIIIVTIFVILSFIASYAAIIFANSNDNQSASLSDMQQMISKYETAYNESLEKIPGASTEYFNDFKQYLSHVTAYNEVAANEGGIKVIDLKNGSGRQLTKEDDNYVAFYVGWCANGSIFDSTLDSTTSPTSFSKILSAKIGMIEGWNLGVDNMYIGGIREITIPSELAYGDSREICDGLNKPLKFMVMPLDEEGVLGEAGLAFVKYIYAAQYGIDYDELMSGVTE